MEKRYWLIKFRERKGLSQSKIAKEIGVSQQMYNYIENGKRNPSPKLAKKIADVLNFSWTKFYED
jgi:transcriptional regulator with XRE-family HTH domain|nr:MAG TPA: Helix-turn-helix XRE-family like protein [Caudoviricetes sp.]